MKNSIVHVIMCEYYEPEFFNEGLKATSFDNNDRYHLCTYRHQSYPDVLSNENRCYF